MVENVYRIALVAPNDVVVVVFDGFVDGCFSPLTTVVVTESISGNQLYEEYSI